MAFPGTTNMMESILCLLDEFIEWHECVFMRLQCVFGECVDCNIAYFLCCLIEEQGESPGKVNWKCLLGYHNKEGLRKAEVATCL